MDERSVRLGTLLPAVVAFAFGCGPTVVREEAGARPYVEVEDLLIPDSAGVFRIARVRELQLRELGSAIAYRPAGDTMQAGGFDMFVYPLTNRVLIDEMQRARADVLDWDARHEDVENSRLGTLDSVTTEHGRHPLYSTRIHATHGGRDVRSFLYLTRVEERFVKVRLTYPAAVDTATDRQVHGFMQAMFDDIARRNAD